MQGEPPRCCVLSDAVSTYVGSALLDLAEHIAIANSNEFEGDRDS